MTSPIAIALVGAAGRMGQEIAKAAAPRSDVRVVAAVERPDSPSLGIDLGHMCGIAPIGVSITDDLDSAFRSAAVAIDLSSPATSVKASASAARAGIAYVCGTTGLGEAELRAIEEAAKVVPVLVASNLSPGVAVLRALVAQAVRALPEYDIEIVEVHHRGKVDAPSGTALDLANCAAREHEEICELRHGRVGRVGPRPHREIGMHAVRGGGVFGDHTVILAGADERLELTHRAGSRALFADGALRAALFLAGRAAGRYTMGDVLGL